MTDQELGWAIRMIEDSPMVVPAGTPDSELERMAQVHRSALNMAVGALHSNLATAAAINGWL